MKLEQSATFNDVRIGGAFVTTSGTVFVKVDESHCVPSYNQHRRDDWRQIAKSQHVICTPSQLKEKK